MTPQEDELLALQFAAIMTASVQNTDSTIKDRIDRSNPCWTQAYADVCAAVDREMRERKRAERAEAKCAAIRDALDALHDFVDGKRHDTENISQIINGAVQGTDREFVTVETVRNATEINGVRLRDYLSTQFWATRGHKPLDEMLGRLESLIYTS